MQAATTTRVPDVLAALETLVATAVPAWQVIVGPKGREKLTRQCVILAASATDGIPAIETSRGTQADGLTVRPVELVTVRCVASTWSGDRDIMALISTAAAMFAALDTALRSAVQLGGVVDTAHLGPDAQWWPMQAPSDALLELDFEISCQAWL